ncbi:MAG: nuclear transport factor 2 family protein [Leptothrix sp. (in: b-proteobacteria)]
MSNEETVKSVYAAFLRQDIAAIQAAVADDVVWRNDGVASNECPWNGNFSGKANLPGFFMAVGENMDLPVFEVKAIAASGNHVAVQLRIEGTVRRTRRAWANDTVHFWTFNERGQIVRYQHFNDTAAELAAWRG